MPSRNDERMSFLLWVFVEYGDEIVVFDDDPIFRYVAEQTVVFHVFPLLLVSYIEKKL